MKADCRPIYESILDNDGVLDLDELRRRGVLQPAVYTDDQIEALARDFRERVLAKQMETLDGLLK